MLPKSRKKLRKKQKVLPKLLPKCSNLSENPFQKRRRNVEISTFRTWWSIGGSNPWPPDCEPGALPAELTPHSECYYMINGKIFQAVFCVICNLSGRRFVRRYKALVFLRPPASRTRPMRTSAAADARSAGDQCARQQGTMRAGGSYFNARSREMVYHGSG